MLLGCVCFGWKWFPFPHVWLSQKMIFSGKWLPVNQYFHLWPGNDFLLSFSLQSISGKREGERAREREEKKPNSQSISRRRRSPVRAPGGAISRRRELAPQIAIDTRRREIAISDRSRDRAVASSRHWLRDRDRWWYFSWVCVFLLFQTPKNIFRKIFWNATKHGEIFSVSRN